ncbi:hypothetical protein NPIL_634021, partial [Nephila pilipes]
MKFTGIFTMPLHMMNVQLDGMRMGRIPYAAVLYIHHRNFYVSGNKPPLFIRYAIASAHSFESSLGK